MRSLALLSVLAFALAPAAHAQNRNPFAPPQAKLFYAPDRTCDLLHVAVDLDVDYAGRTIKGKSVNSMAALRSGIQEVLIHAGTGLDIQSVKVDGRTAKFRRAGKDLFIETGLLAKGKPFQIEVAYQAKDSRGTGFGSGGGGWHWISPRDGIADRVGFWTQGETQYNSEWAPTWDYPNDLATSETRTTVQSDWSVIGNGVLVSDRAEGQKRTFHWKMDQPHATYLLALYGGPFDIKKDKWEGIDLWYVVPKGLGYLIDDSFGDTKDMLSFFSKRVGVKYPWPKYAQVAMYDFGGGMENVSATILGEGSLTDRRDGFRRMASLNAHELGHQWFGDLVTCMHWGDIYLNESFATFMDAIYMEHSRGSAAYQWAIEDDMRSYFAESRRYKRPLSTKLYANPDSMFDSHSYPKGAAILHTLRRQLGDDPFFAGLKHYLDKWRHTPVESAQLRRALSDSTGINVEPFWAQWIDSPGHPVLDYSWTYDGGKLKVTVKQTQDTASGTPIYEIPAHIGFSDGGAFKLLPLRISKAEETFELALPAKPKAVLLDPNHDFLREIPTLRWSSEELPFIFQFAPNASDRQDALAKLAAASNPDLALIRQVLEADRDLEQPVFRSTGLDALVVPDMRAFWLGQLGHPNIDRQVQASSALARLPKDAPTVARFRSLINANAPIQVVVNAINALSAWDKAGNVDVFRRALEIKDRRGRIKRAAEEALKP